MIGFGPFSTPLTEAGGPWPRRNRRRRGLRPARRRGKAHPFEMSEMTRVSTGLSRSWNSCMPLPTTMGCTSRCSSSSSPAANSWRTTETEPLIPMSPPGSFLSAVTASPRSPWIRSTFRQPNSWFCRDTTTCGCRRAGRRTSRPHRRPLRPGTREAVVGHAPEEQRVRALVVLADGGAHVLVEVREVPVVRRLDNPVQRNEHACRDFPHDRLTIGAGKLIVGLDGRPHRPAVRRLFILHP